MTIIQRKVKLDQESLEWFEESFPNTSLSGVINLMLEKMRANMKENTLNYHVTHVAKEITEGD